MAENGEVDLTRWNFDRDGAVRLDGKWEFYWERLIAPEDFRRSDGFPEMTHIDVPGSWTYHNISGKSVPSQGYATYRLKVKLPDGQRRYGLKIQEMGTAYRLWANGAEISGNGVTGVTRETETPQFLPRTVLFRPHSSEVELVLHVSNHHDSMGGFWHTMRLGMEDHVIALREWSIAMEAGLASALFIMALYHAFLYLLRRKDSSPLYFSVFCALMGVRALMMGERLIVGAFPDINWELQLKIEHITLYLPPAVFVLYLRSLYREETSKLFTIMMITAALVCSMIVALAPARIHTLFNAPYHILLFAAILYVLVALTRAIWKRREGSVIFLSGFILLSIPLTNDILYDFNYVNTRYIAPWGVYIFIFFQSAVLSMRFSRSFSKVESLSEELMIASRLNEEYSANLEKQVSERTVTISEQNNFLREQIDLAARYQRALLPGSIPVTNHAIIAVAYEPMMGVGGDFYHFFQSGEDLGVFICDVSGHGIAAAFLASMVRMSLNKWEDTLKSPASTLEVIRESLTGKLNNNFISACVCHMDLASGNIRVASAGHPSIIVLGGNGNAGFIVPRGRVITDVFGSEFIEETAVLSPGDRIVLYTDGVIEARNDKNELFGESSFVRMLLNRRHEKPEAVCNTVLRELGMFVGEHAGFEDDITMVVLDYTG